MKVRRVPIRSCVVCRQTSDKKTLLRVVRAPEKDGGGVAADPTGRANGRGAYVCTAIECIEKAAKQKRFERALSAPVPATLMEDLKAMAAKIADVKIAETKNAETNSPEKAPAAVQNIGATAL